MDEILKELNLGTLVSRFKDEKITPDIVGKLSKFELQSLGLIDSSKIMNLRLKCLNYGSSTLCRAPGSRIFQIPEDILHFFLECQFTVTDIAKLLSVSESTVYRRMRQCNLTKKNVSNISDEDLDSLIQEVVQEFPLCGENMIKELLIQKTAIQVTRMRLRESLHRLDDIGIQDRKKRRLHRRIYNVDGVNHMWHIDTNHKLIRWNFIVYGGIDGFNRFITFLSCRDNNKAVTLLDSFRNGVANYGMPLRVRSDKGRLDTCLVADYMIKERGPNRGSMITGKSCHNQQIERSFSFYGRRRLP